MAWSCGFFQKCVGVLEGGWCIGECVANEGLIIGFAFFFIVLLIVSFCGCYFCCFRNKNKPVVIYQPYATQPGDVKLNLPFPPGVTTPQVTSAVLPPPVPSKV